MLKNVSFVFRYKAVLEQEWEFEMLKICPTTRHGGGWGARRYSSYSYSALDGVSGQRHAQAAL
jgi:hypothetical protein